MSKEKKDYLVVKHNSLINAKSEEPYTLNQMKLICHLISHIKPEDTNFETKEVLLKDLNFDSIESGSNYTKLTSEFVQLLKKPFKVPGSMYWVNWVSAIGYSDGIIKYRFDPCLVPYLLELKDNFTFYQLKNILSLKRVYSIRLYELLLQNLVIGSRTIELEELRALLNIPKSYKNNDITTLVKDIQQELKEKTDISFTFKPIKRVREFASIEFKIKQVKQIKQKLIPANTSLRSSLKSMRVSDNDQ